MSVLVWCSYCPDPVKSNKRMHLDLGCAVIFTSNWHLDKKAMNGKFLKGKGPIPRFIFCRDSYLYIPVILSGMSATIFIDIYYPHSGPYCPFVCLSVCSSYSSSRTQLSFFSHTKLVYIIYWTYCGLLGKYGVGLLTFMNVHIVYVNVYQIWSELSQLH